MKILLTGSNGYIGSNLSSFLKQKNFDILNISRDSIDLKDIVSLEKVFESNEIDIIIHCAAKAKLQTDSPESDFLENIKITQNLVTLHKKYNIKKFIFLSSYMVYGNEYTIDKSNLEYSNPFEWYSNSKYICEEIIKQVVDNYLILRLPTVINGESNSIFLDFIKCIKSNKKIQIYGNGENQRNYLLLDDLLKFVYDNLYSNISFCAPYSFTANVNNIIKIFSENMNSIDIEYIQSENKEKILNYKYYKISDTKLNSEVFNNCYENIYIKE